MQWLVEFLMGENIATGGFGEEVSLGHIGMEVRKRGGNQYEWG